ncbi:MAG: THUMP domain-containing class I SAM-dependent RNA methyltransferase [Acidobacteriota bacterium]
MSKVDLIATATFGLEAVVAREVKRLGYEDVTVENARVSFSADQEAVCRSNLWLRSADRVLIKMGEFTATTFEELFEQTKALPWGDWLPENACFPVEGKSIKSGLFSVPDCQAIVKKAVVEKMKQKYRRNWFDENGPRYTIEVALLKDVATLTIDSSGAGLHKRGYRKLSSIAPLKETLAAAMISLSRWHPDRLLIDPFCGSGTIPIEAAMIGLNMAPGMQREFASQKWQVIPSGLWKKAVEEARDSFKPRDLKIRGTDIDKDVISMARYHAKLAGVDKYIHFQQAPVSELMTKDKFGFIICNPPYGERLSETTEVEKLYREMSDVFKKLDTWSFYVLTAHPGFERLFGRIVEKKRKLYNGRIQCNYFQYPGPKPPGLMRKSPPDDNISE